MTNIRRYYIPDSIVFITQVVHSRSPVFRTECHLGLLRKTMREAKRLYPFLMLAYVFLSDHFHLLIKPEPGVTHTQIMHSIKPNFTKAYMASLGIDGPMRFWQRRYWDHIIRDEYKLEKASALHPLQPGQARFGESAGGLGAQQLRTSGKPGACIPMNGAGFFPKR